MEHKPTAKDKNIAWQVANGHMTKAEAARKLKLSVQGVDTRLFNGLVATLKDREVIS